MTPIVMYVKFSKRSKNEVQVSGSSDMIRDMATAMSMNIQHVYFYIPDEAPRWYLIMSDKYKYTKE